MRIFILFFLALFLTGCLSKKAPHYSYYEIDYNGSECQNRVKNTNSVYLHDVEAISFIDSRNITVFENGKMSYKKDAKFISFPSEMIYKSIVNALSNSCHLKPIFTQKDSKFTLKTKLISFRVDNKRAEIILGYEVLKSQKIENSGVIKKYLNLKDLSTEEIIKSMNKVSNLAIDELIGEIK